MWKNNFRSPRKRLSFLSWGFMFLCASCFEQPQSKIPQQGAGDLHSKVQNLQEKVTQLTSENEYHNEGYSLNQSTITEVTSYLKKLYENINTTREEHLPEWQEMYEALTNERALEKDGLTVGKHSKPTNFSLLNEIAKDHRLRLDNSDEKRALINEDVTRLTKNQSLHEKRLATIDANIDNLNSQIKLKMESIDSLLKTFDGRILATETRMNTLQQTVDGMTQRFDELDQRISNVQRILDRYDLATMNRNIENLLKESSEQAAKIIDLDGRIVINTSGILDLKNDLSSLSQEVSNNSTDLGSSRADIDGIIERLENCPCFQ